MADPIFAAEGHLAGFPYFVYYTGGAQPGQPLPVAVIFHYYTATPAMMLPLFTRISAPGCLVFPQAPFPAADGFSWFPSGFYDQDLVEQNKPLKKIAADLAVFLKELPTHLGLAGKPLVTGFSQGGDLSYALAMEYPETIGMAIPMGGRLEPQFRPERASEASRKVPIRVLHGEKDPIVLIETVRNGVRWLETHQCDVQLIAYPEGQHDAPPALQRDLHMLINGYFLSILGSQA